MEITGWYKPAGWYKSELPVGTIVKDAKTHRLGVIIDTITADIQEKRQMTGKRRAFVRWLTIPKGTLYTYQESLQ